MTPEEEIKSLKKKLKQASLTLILCLTALLCWGASGVMSYHSSKQLNKAVYRCKDKCVKKVGFNSYDCVDCAELVQ